MEPNNILANSA